MGACLRGLPSAASSPQSSGRVVRDEGRGSDSRHPDSTTLSKCYLQGRCAPKSSRGSASAYGDGSGSSGPVDEPLEPANHVQVVGRGEPSEDVEDMRVRPHENTGLARLHTAVDDLRG